MDFRLVLVEREEVTTNKVYSSSGLLIDNKFVLLTSNIFMEALSQKEEIMRQLTIKKIVYIPFQQTQTSLNVVSKDDQGLYIVKKARVFCIFVSTVVKYSSESLFKNWALDSIDNNTDLSTSLSMFFILSLNFNCGRDDLKNSLRKWWDLLGRLHINKCDPVHIESAPFANRHFINFHSKGIVSNILGKHSCLILSDCPSSPGSEGSPVFIDNSTFNYKYPVGIVLSSVSWWRGEWIGCTLIVDIRSIILELIDIPLRLDNIKKESVNHNIVANSEFSLVQIYSGNSWGTAILLNSEQGIFLTNSHVIESTDLNMFYKNRKFAANLIYKTPDNAVFDLALVKCQSIVFEEKMKSISISRRKCNVGDMVYSAGFSIFSKECQPTPTLSKGCISQNHVFMLRTTCSVHPGASGGAIMDTEGALLGIIVCNTKISDNNAVFPRVNMAVPFSAVSEIIFTYLAKRDLEVLKKLHMAPKEAQLIWKQLESKL